MAGTRIYMTAEKKQSLSEIHAKIHYIEGAEQIFYKEMPFADGTVCLLVYEKYYFRNNSYASLTVLVTEQGTRQTAQIVATGGGASLSNTSLGANRNFAQKCVQALEECGFCVNPEHSDPPPKGLVERFYK